MPRLFWLSHIQAPSAGNKKCWQKYEENEKFSTRNQTNGHHSKEIQKKSLFPQELPDLKISSAGSTTFVLQNCEASSFNFPHAKMQKLFLFQNRIEALTRKGKPTPRNPQMDGPPKTSHHFQPKSSPYPK